jgi:hypothetical protein
VQLEERTSDRGRFFEVFDRKYRMRFLLLGLAAFLNNVFSAPSSQLMNRYLTKEHNFTNAGVRSAPRAPRRPARAGAGSRCRA